MPAGRPPFKPTAKMRRRVAIVAGSGRMSHEEIAIGLGIARNTLLKHFEAELTTGAYECRQEVVEAMHKAAEKGNVTAARAYLEDTPRAAAPPPVPPLEKDEKPEPMGKKEKANADAVTAAKGTEWEDILKPSRLQ